MSHDTPIPLVPGDDWEFEIQTLDQDGAAVDLTGWTILKRSVASGAVTFDVDVVLAPGVARIAAGHVVTGALRMGNVSTLTIQVQSPDGKHTTVIVKPINGVKVRHAVQASVTLLGVQGPIGVQWRDDLDDGEWLSGGAYQVRDGVALDGTSYRALQAHVADAASKPGVGANWQDFWAVIAQGANAADVAVVVDNIGAIVAVGTNVASVNTVAGSIGAVLAVAAIDDDVSGVAAIAAQIVTTASLATQIQTVATYSAAIVTVSANIAGVNLAAANMAAILDAPAQAAAAAVSAADALTYSSQALGYKDQANGYQLLAANYASNASDALAAMIAALASVTNYDNTAGQLLGGGKQALVAANAVATVSGDTGKDSDGGAWRWRMRGSVFTEALGTATRGLRNFLPKRPRIIGQAATLTIQDGDDKAFPLWKIWTVAGLTSVTMMNGNIVYGSLTGVYVIDLLNDAIWRYSTAGLAKANQNVASYNQGTAVFTVVDAAKTLGHDTINSLAVSIYPGTPIDPVRRLPTPTIACGSPLGVGVMHWDGRVAKSNSTQNQIKIAFEPDGTLVAGNTNGPMQFADPATYASTNFVFTQITPFPWPYVSGTPFAAMAADAVGTTAGLGLLKRVKAGNNTLSLIAAITSTFNTGWYQIGAKMALAESAADVTSLVAATPLSDNFSTYADTAAMKAAGYTETALRGTIALVGAEIELTADPSAPSGVNWVEKAVTTVVGKAYVFRADGYRKQATGGVFLGTNNAAATWGPSSLSSVLAPITPLYFVATSTTTIVRARFDGAGGLKAAFKNLRVDAAVANRGAAIDGTTIAGTVTRAAVAAGAELAAYGGFSAANYLNAPAFDIGSGDFMFSAWVQGPTLNRTIFSKFQTGGTGGVSIYAGTGGALTFRLSNNGFTTADQATGGPSLTDGAWHLLNCIRRGTVMECWVDGVRVATANIVQATGSLSDPNLNTRIGVGSDGGAAWLGLIALPKVGFTAPTPAQIRTMYAAELPMFQAGAKCLLTATDSVQALDYDAGTDLLYVAKAAGGTDVFKGLLRLGSLTMASENALASELVVNGGFAADTNFAKGSGVTISGGTLNFVATPNASGITQTAVTPLVAGDVYLVTYDLVSVAVGGIRVLVGNVTTATRTTPGTYREIVTTPATSQVLALIAVGTGTSVIDNFSIRKVTTLRLASDNHKGVSASNDNIAIFTDVDCYAKTPSISLREAVDTAIGRAATPSLYNRNVIERPSCAVTGNATPTVIGSFPLDKGEALNVVVETIAREYGDPASQEFAAYRDQFLAFRPGEGNIALSGASVPTVVREVTASMAVAIQVNTTTQMVEILATGVAAKNLEWGYRVTFTPVAVAA